MLAVDYFNRNHPLHAVKERVALSARRKIYERVIGLARPGPDTKVLDVGVTPDLEIPYNNFFERWYPHTRQITTSSIEDCSNLERAFPGITFQQTDDVRLPFADRSFDLALSFAVLEHVGSAEQQRRFVAELSRVARAFVLYTPYRYFPVEMHTLLPFTHWLPNRWYRALWRRIGLSFWAEESNLNLVTFTDAHALLPTAGRGEVRCVRVMGWPSNIEVFWQEDEGKASAGHRGGRSS